VSGNGDVETSVRHEVLLEPFRALTVRNGNTAGLVLMAAMAEVGNDGKPVQQPRPKQRLSTVSAQLCESPQLQWWWRVFITTPSTADECADMLRDELVTLSRAELDSNEDGAAGLHERIRKPFVEWQRG